MADPHSNTDSSAKVVAFDSAYLQARMPKLFTQLKECSQQGFMPLLQALFDHVDDALFEMADKADSNAAQNMYFESMREVRLKRRGMELAFLQSIDEAFYCLVEAKVDSKVTNDVDEKTAGELSLVPTDVQDELMASGSLVRKAENRFIEPLALLLARSSTLLEGQKITAANNPIGPAVICQAFISACQALDAEVNAKLVLFKLFDRYVIEGLGDLYSSCNRLLADAGILSDATAASLMSGRPSASQPMARSNSSEVFDNLQALLQAAPQVTASNTAVGLQSVGQAPQIPHESLMALLQHVQQQLAVSPAAQSVEKLDIQQVLNALFLERLPGQAASIGKLEDDTINLVAMLFQFVLEDRNLSEPIKALLARMQIPIVKVAMEDKSFFSKGGHPARKLLNAMATACLGWQEPKNMERDPLYKKLTAIVNHLLEDFEDDGEVFEEILADFNDFIVLEKRRASLIEQRTLDAEDGKAKSELARVAVKALLQEKLTGQNLPPVVMTLLQEAWSNVLFLLNLKEGEDSKAWQQGVKVVDELLWSVQPMQSSTDRKQLLKLIPQLLKALRSGLTQVAFNPFEMNRLFDELENIHLAQLKQPSVSEPVDEKIIETAVLATSVEKAPQSLDLAELTEAECSEVSSRLGDVDDNLLADTSSPRSDVAEPQSNQTLDQLLENKRTAEGHKSPGEPSVESLDAELMGELGALDELEGFGEDSQTNIQGAEADISPAAKPGQNDIFLQRVDILSIGNWLEILQDDGSRLRCRLAAIIRGTGKYIFVNRAGMKVSEHTRESLAQAIEAGEVSLLDDGLLFDRALESVIGNLRDMKSTGA